MGNCLRNNQISAQEDQKYEPPRAPSEAKTEAVERKKTSSSKLQSAPREESMKKMVRFILQKDDKGSGMSGSSSSSGHLTIRLVVTREELKSMLSYENDAQHTSLEQLSSAMKLRGRQISLIEDYDGSINPWRPALESIPEDLSIK